MCVCILCKIRGRGDSFGGHDEEEEVILGDFLLPPRLPCLIHATPLDIHMILRMDTGTLSHSYSNPLPPLNMYTGKRGRLLPFCWEHTKEEASKEQTQVEEHFSWEGFLTHSAIFASSLSVLSPLEAL